MRRVPSAALGVALGTICLGLVPTWASTQSLALTGQVVVVPGGRPLAGVEIAITALSRSVRSDSNGVFLMDSVPRGRSLVEARMLGYRAFSSYFSVQSAYDPDYRIELVAVPTQVATLTVSADAVNVRLADFETRRARGGGGHFFSARELAANQGRPLADVLAIIPGIDVVRGPSGAAWLGGNRGVATLRADGLPRVSVEDRARGARVGLTCYAAVVLNGVVMYDGTTQNLFDINSIAPQDIAGIEFYGGPASMPVQFNTLRPTCGLIAIWTR